VGGSSAKAARIEREFRRKLAHSWGRVADFFADSVGTCARLNRELGLRQTELEDLLDFRLSEEGLVRPSSNFALQRLRVGVALLLLISALWAQHADPAGPHPGRNVDPLLAGLSSSYASTENAWTFHKRVDEVTLFFTATDRRRFVQDLGLDNIRVYDDHQLVTQISAFQQQLELPLHIGLVVDTSGSVNPRFHFEQESAIQFLRQIVRKGVDSAFIMGFSDHGRFAQDYSDDTEQLAKGVMELHNGGSTAIFDAIRTASLKLAGFPADEQPAARILIVLSDGEDNASQSTLRQALDVAAAEEVTIYTIDTNVESIEYRQSDGSLTGHVVLKHLAEQTGGRSFSQMNATGVARAFATIEEEIRSRFVLSYHPENLVEDGRFRQVQIIAEKSGRRYHVHARQGYYARERRTLSGYAQDETRSPH
jgi:Ca-activated chloride channel family protein